MNNNNRLISTMANTQILSVPTVEKEIQRYPDMKVEHLQILKDWIRKQPHLPFLDDDLLLLQFLRRCHYSVEKAKTKVDNYLSFRTHFPELATNRGAHEPDIIKIFENWQWVSLPNRDQQGHLVFIGKLLTEGPTDFHVGALLKLSLSYLEIYIRENGTVPGYALVIDLQNAGLPLLAKCTLTICKQVYFFIQKCCPSSVKGVYVVNSNSVAETATNLFKSIIQTKMIRQVQVFPRGAIENLYKHIPKEILPEEYGGNAGSMKDLNKNTYEAIKRGGEYFTTLDKLKVHEERRTSGKLSLNHVYGLDGTFKKLNVD